MEFAATRDLSHIGIESSSASTLFASLRPIFRSFFVLFLLPSLFSYVSHFPASFSSFSSCLCRYVSLFASFSRSSSCFLVFSQFLHPLFFSFPSFVFLSLVHLPVSSLSPSTTFLVDSDDGGRRRVGGSGGGKPNYEVDRDAANF